MRSESKPRDDLGSELSRRRGPKVRERTLERAGRDSPAANRARSLRSVTLRLSPDVAERLRRASIQRSLGYEEPFTQQSITECALREWLLAHGYRGT